MIVAIIALFAALTGSAYAALGKNTVGSKQLKAKAITSVASTDELSETCRRTV